MRRLVAALLALAACGPPPSTPCGMVLDDYLTQRDSRAGWLSPDDLRAAESAWLEYATLVSDPRYQRLCEWVNGLRAIPMPTDQWFDDWGRDVFGLAFPARDLLTGEHLPGGSVQVGHPPPGMDWHHSTLTHEVMHIVEGRQPAPPCTPDDGPHCGWLLPGGASEIILHVSGDR